VLASKPSAYWRFEDIAGITALDSIGSHNATVEGGVAWYLPGVDGRNAHQPPQPTTPNAFSGARINRAAHFAGGKARAKLPIGDSYTAELWIWNGLPVSARAITGYVFSRESDGNRGRRLTEQLGIGGTNQMEAGGRLIFGSSADARNSLTGRTTLLFRAWHHIALIREGENIRIHLDGHAEPDIEGHAEVPPGVNSNTVVIGGSMDGAFNFEGKIDEVALYPRALPASEINAHYRAASIARTPRPSPK
jgi:hypothetical protein